jgi:hypothetical protein
MKLGFLELSPDERRLYIDQAALRRNLSPINQAMRDMSLTEPASFDDILATLAELERRINQAVDGQA